MSIAQLFPLLQGQAEGGFFMSKKVVFMQFENFKWITVGNVVFVNPEFRAEWERDSHA